MNENIKINSGFSLIELLVVIGIIAVLASVVLVATGSARLRSRDAKRKADMDQIGRMLYASSCYAPNGGAGDYDLADLIPELTTKYPQYAQLAFLLPYDPKTGSSSKTNYRYTYATDGHCVVYMNLENQNEPITMGSLSAPTPGAGQGVLKSATEGPNGTNIIYQVGK